MTPAAETTVRRAGTLIEGATVGEVEVEVGGIVEVLTWDDDRVWLKVRRLYESEELGVCMTGTRSSERDRADLESYLGFGALPLSRVVQPVDAKRAAERSRGERPRCGWEGCDRFSAGVRPAGDVKRAGGGEVEARSDGMVQLCKRHRAEVDDEGGRDAKGRVDRAAAQPKETRGVHAGKRGRDQAESGSEAKLRGGGRRDVLRPRERGASTRRGRIVEADHGEEVKKMPSVTQKNAMQQASRAGAKAAKTASEKGKTMATTATKKNGNGNGESTREVRTVKFNGGELRVGRFEVRGSGTKLEAKCPKCGKWDSVKDGWRLRDGGTALYAHRPCEAERQKQYAKPAKPKPAKKSTTKKSAAKKSTARKSAAKS